MVTSIVNDNQEEWIKILGKGMITIPKSFREDLGIKEGEVAKIKKVGRRLIIEPRETMDYEIYSDNELKKMLKEDKLPKELTKKVLDKLMMIKLRREEDRILKLVEEGDEEYRTGKTITNLI